MDKRSKELYMEAIGMALNLACGKRDEDYNKGGVGLRDYWAVNGIYAPLQMVDMKVKRAISQIGLWRRDEMDKPYPMEHQQVEAVLESMADAINYAAFVFCEAASLLESRASEQVKTEHGAALAAMLKSHER